MKIILTDAELDYCNAEGIPAEKFALSKSKLQALKPKSSSGKKIKMDSELAKLIKVNDARTLKRRIERWNKQLANYLSNKG